ncbi:MAG: hypothetical protein Q8N21_01860 [bacterium]|nr:hypothetical protein [bacterium]
MATPETDFSEEAVVRTHGWQAKNEAEYFREEILPNINDKEKEGVLNLLVNIFYL